MSVSRAALELAALGERHPIRLLTLFQLHEYSFQDGHTFC